MYASAPVFNPSRLSSSLDFAVSSMTGIWLTVTFCLILRQRVSPSISGIMMSLIIRSGTFFKMRLSASLPLVHACMWKFAASSWQM